MSANTAKRIGATEAAALIGTSLARVCQRSQSGELPFILDDKGRRSYSVDELQPFIGTKGPPSVTLTTRTIRESPAEILPNDEVPGRIVQVALSRAPTLVGSTEPRAIRAMGLAILADLASQTTTDTRVRAMCAGTLAQIASREVQTTKSSAQDYQSLQDLSDDELVDLRALIAEVRARRKNLEAPKTEPVEDLAAKAAE